MYKEVDKMTMDSTLVEDLYQEDAMVEEVMIEEEILITKTKTSKISRLIFHVTVEEIHTISWIRQSRST